MELICIAKELPKKLHIHTKDFSCHRCSFHSTVNQQSICNIHNTCLILMYPPQRMHSMEINVSFPSLFFSKTIFREHTAELLTNIQVFIGFCSRSAKYRFVNCNSCKPLKAVPRIMLVFQCTHKSQILLKRQKLIQGISLFSHTKI